jgi:hypothetical protein
VGGIILIKSKKSFLLQCVVLGVYFNWECSFCVSLLGHLSFRCTGIICSRSFKECSKAQIIAETTAWPYVS